MLRRGNFPILFNDLLWQLAAQWKPIAHAAELSLEIEFPRQACYVLGNERRLRWAIGNLIDNAIRYSLPYSYITINSIIHSDQSQVYLEIVDNGVGISAEDMLHIFERFYRGKPILPDGSLLTQPGSGQGLYLSQKIINAHGGAIQLESQVEQGTTVHLWLPLTADITFPMPAQPEEKEGDLQRDMAEIERHQH